MSLATYAKFLRHHSATQNLLSSNELERLESRHFADCLNVLKLPNFKPTGTLVDIGSGNGLPGIVIAISCPELQVTCLEAELRKCEFLNTVITELPLANAKVLRGRAEELAHEAKFREQFDMATSRACAAWPSALELACTWLKPGGYFFLFGSPVQLAELATSKACEILKMELTHTHIYKLEADQEVVIGTFKKGPDSTSERYPRRWNQVSKQPL